MGSSQSEGNWRISDAIRRAVGERTRAMRLRRSLQAVLAGSLLFVGVVVTCVSAAASPASPTAVGLDQRPHETVALNSRLRTRW